MTTVQPPTRDDVDQAVRRAIEALAGLGSLEALHPADRARIGAAAAAFTREIRNITRRTDAARAVAAAPDAATAHRGEARQRDRRD